MADDPLQRAGADVAGGPLDNPVGCRLGAHASIPFVIVRSAAIGQRCLVQDILGQTHVGGIDQLAVPADGPYPVGLGAAVSLDGVSGLLDLAAVGAKTSWAMAIWSGWMAHLPSYPNKLACTADRRNPSGSW